MTNTTHTPGPWFVEEPNRNRVRSLSREIRPGMGRDIIATDLREADARLIAAAPKLLAALEGLLDATEHLLSDQHPAVIAADAAIAKAKGD